MEVTMEGHQSLHYVQWLSEHHSVLTKYTLTLRERIVAMLHINIYFMFLNQTYCI